MAERVEFSPIKGDEDAALSPQDERKSRRSGKKRIAITAVIVVVLFIAAFIGGYLVTRAIKPGCGDKDKEQEKQKGGNSDSLQEEAVKAISKEKIEEHLG